LADPVEVDTVQLGETMVIEGKTNRDPDDTSITVEAVRGPSHEKIGDSKSR